MGKASGSVCDSQNRADLPFDQLVVDLRWDEDDLQVIWPVLRDGDGRLYASAPRELRPTLGNGRELRLYFDLADVFVMPETILRRAMYLPACSVEDLTESKA